MNKKQLVELGLTDEQITEVFRLNGLVVNAAKAELDTKVAEVETLQGQLETANKEIEGFKGLDVEGIKKAAEEYKTKFEETKLQSQKEIENLKFEHMLESKLINAGAKNVKAAKVLLNIEELSKSKNLENDIQVAIDESKTADPYLYKDNDPVGTGGSMGAAEKSKAAGITKESILSIEDGAERRQRISENLELFN